ncbi:uncharacterized protein [Onthophagus taurus]|uniref:uncharacterized protein n=1 Tax=Onthophagus taurus TaxID=166361 RepID=UPI0039BE06C9
MSFIYCIFLIIIPVTCKSIDETKCLNIPLIKDFDIRKMVGNWVLHEAADEEEVLKKCIYYKTSLDANKGNTTYIVKRIWENNSDSFNMYPVNNTSKFVTEWLGQIRMTWLVATDYNNYSIWYVCYPENPQNSAFGISTRLFTINNNVMQKAKELVRKIGLHNLLPRLQNINHENCFKQYKI